MQEANILTAADYGEIDRDKDIYLEMQIER